MLVVKEGTPMKRWSFFLTCEHTFNSQDSQPPPAAISTTNSNVYKHI